VTSVGRTPRPRRTPGPTLRLHKKQRPTRASSAVTAPSSQGDHLTSRFLSPRRPLSIARSAGAAFRAERRSDRRARAIRGSLLALHRLPDRGRSRGGARVARHLHRGRQRFRPGAGAQPGRHEELDQQSRSGRIDDYLLRHRSWPDHSAGRRRRRSPRRAAPVNTVAIYIDSLYISGPQFKVGPAPSFPADVFIGQAVIPSPNPLVSTTLPGPMQLQIAVSGVLSRVPFVGYSTVEIAVK
jgi:hypothetical protein